MIILQIIEMQKFVGSLFFTWDEELRCPITGEIPICNSSDLNEELGQVGNFPFDLLPTCSYIFCILGSISFYRQDRHSYRKQHGIPPVFHWWIETHGKRRQFICRSR